MLTLKKLKEMEPGPFARGELLEERLHREPVKWMAVRGGYWDWAIYYHDSLKSWEYVRSNGDKICTEAVIRELVACDDEA